LYVCLSSFALVFFFFQAEDGIRDPLVTGVQTCALPILKSGSIRRAVQPQDRRMSDVIHDTLRRPLASLRLSVTDRCNLRCRYCKIGRASCRERVGMSVAAVPEKNTKMSDKVRCLLDKQW